MARYSISGFLQRLFQAKTNNGQTFFGKESSEGGRSGGSVPGIFQLASESEPSNRISPATAVLKGVREDYQAWLDLPWENEGERLCQDLVSNQLYMVKIQSVIATFTHHQRTLIKKLDEKIVELKRDLIHNGPTQDEFSQSIQEHIQSLEKEVVYHQGQLVLNHEQDSSSECLEVIQRIRVGYNRARMARVRQQG